MTDFEATNEWHKRHFIAVIPSRCTEGLVEFHFEVMDRVCIYYVNEYQLSDMERRQSNDELHEHRTMIMSAVMHYINCAIDARN